MGIFSKFIDRAKRNAEPPNIYSMPITPENAQQRSELFHEKHMKNIEGYEKFDKKDVINRDLTPKEVSFLKYVDGKEPEAIAGYWTHEEALDIAKELRIFFANGYAEYTTDPKSLRVSDIKELLSAKGIPTSGKKADLIVRLLESYSAEEISALGLPRVIKLTEKGRKVANSTPISLMHDHILDYRCLKQIIDGNPDAASLEVRRYKRNMPTHGAPGAFSSGEAARVPDCLFNLEVFPTKEDNDLFKALIILSWMLGKGFPSKKYLSNWMGESFPLHVSDDEIKKVCERMHKKYEGFEYPDALPDISEARWEKLNDKSLTAISYELAGRIDMAIPIYEELVSKGYNSKSTFNSLIKIYTKTGLDEDAIRIADAEVKLFG